MSNLNNEPLLPVTLYKALKNHENHSLHSFLWTWNDKDFAKMTCDKAGTIEESLRRSGQFLKTAKKNKEKELVIKMDGKAISQHFPCASIKKAGTLTVKYVKAVEQPKKPVGAYVSFCRNKLPSELVVFHVLTTGGKNIVKVMKNKFLTAMSHEITIYAYKGEKVKRALKRDGRLLGSIFKKNFVLSNKSTGVKTELSNLVDELNDETFQIILLDKSSPPQSLSGSLDDAYVVVNEDQGQSQAENHNTLKQEPELNKNITLGNLSLEVPNSNRTQYQFCFQFEESLEGIKTIVPELSHIQNLFRVDFGQNALMCSEVKNMKKMMRLSDSVCQVRINGKPHGTGFLLFGSYVLTNGHVINSVYDENRGQLNERVSVHFCYDDVEQTEGGLDVIELGYFEHSPDVPGADWALLKLDGKEILPSALLKYFGPLPKDGRICIIGHPGGGVKKIDSCLIVPSQNRLQVVERHYRENQGLVESESPSFFEGVVAYFHQKGFLTYESCFYHASSGSPVFDSHCNIVAVHSGGFIYRSMRGETQSVIEFAHPLQAIMERLIIQVVVRKKHDVLKDFLAYTYARHEVLMNGVKNLVEKENLIEFRNAVNNLFTVNLNDTTLYNFSKFFCQKDEYVPMEIS